MEHLGAVPKTNGYQSGSGEHQPIRSEALLIGTEPCTPDEGLLSEQRL